jgi:two-component system, NarL family, response regulator DesR
MKVMIVDDNAEMRGLIRTILAETASDFVECADGREAVAVYQAEHPDWTVMDVAMRAMDGLTATRLLRAKDPQAQVLIMTQYHSPSLQERAREAGASGFLAKEALIELPNTLAKISPKLVATAN